MDNISDLLEICSLDDLVKGYTFNDKSEEFICLICCERMNKDEIFKRGEKLFQSEKNMELHIKAEHGSALLHWLSLDRKLTGISEQHTKIIKYIVDGLSDREIAKKLGDLSESTVRNHRFNLREKSRQAKIFLAIMKGLENYLQEKRKFVSVPANTVQRDERCQVTEEEKDKIVSKYFNSSEQLTKYPKKEKERIIVLMKILSFFQTGKRYTEKEVNAIIKERFIDPDYVLIRRALIDRLFMERKADGSEYWRKV